MAPKRGTKRGIDRSQEGSSPLRRSKRYISEAGLGPTSPPATAAGNGHETGPVSEREEEGDEERRDDEKDQGSKAAKSGRAGRYQRTSKQVTESTTETKLTASVKLRTKERTTRTRSSHADQDEEEQLDGEEEKQEEEQEEEITIKKKVTRKTKTKKEEEDEVEDMPPLAARTPGLRMFVGAHVSAAKGPLLSLPSFLFALSSYVLCVYRLRSFFNIGVHNAVTNSVHIGYISPVHTTFCLPKRLTTLFI